MVCACNLGTPEIKVGRPKVQGYLQLQGKLSSDLGHIRLSQNRKKRKKGKQNKGKRKMGK